LKYGYGEAKKIKDAEKLAAMDAYSKLERVDEE